MILDIDRPVKMRLARYRQEEKDPYSETNSKDISWHSGFLDFQGHPELLLQLSMGVENYSSSLLQLLFSELKDPMPDKKMRASLKILRKDRVDLPKDTAILIGINNYAGLSVRQNLNPTYDSQEIGLVKLAGNRNFSTIIKDDNQYQNELKWFNRILGEDFPYALVTYELLKESCYANSLNGWRCQQFDDYKNEALERFEKHVYLGR
jgi:hypothetical protein